MSAAAAVPKTVKLHDFVASFKTQDNPEGIYPALAELERRGVRLPYMTLHRWLEGMSRPGPAWALLLRRMARVEVGYIKAAKKA